MYSRSEEVQAKVFRALRHGPLTLDELATEINEPPFTVGAFLKSLRRERLVFEETLRTPKPVYRLTANGETAALLSEQLRLV